MEINGDWNTNEMFDLYLYNHLRMKNMHQTAEAFRRETRLNIDREMTADGDFLREWWGINYDILQSSLQSRRQVPQEGVSAAEAEPVTRTREEDVRNAQVLETGTCRNPGKFPMNLADSSQILEHPSAVSLSAELQQQQLFRQFLDENTAAGTRSRSQQQQLYPEQDQARLAKGKAIAIENTARATTDHCSAAKVADLGTGSSIDAGLTRRLPLPLPLTGWPLIAGGSIGPQPDPLSSANHFLRAVSPEPQFIPTPGRRQEHFFQPHNSKADNRSSILGSYADHIAPRLAFSSNSLQNAMDKSLVQGRQSDELRNQMQKLQEITVAQNFREVHYKHNHEKAAAGVSPSPNGSQAENSSMPSSYFKQNHSEWKRKLEGIVFEEIGCLQSKNKLLCCNFSSDGKLLASAGHDRKVFIWSTDTFKMTKTPQAHTHSISDVRFCPNSTVFATSSFDRTLGIWDANGGKPLGMLVGHTEAVTSLDFHPRNVNVLCSSHIYGEIRLWSVNQGVCLRVSKDSPRFPLTYRHGASKQLRFDPQSGNLLAAASGNTIRIIDVETDSSQLYLEGHKDAVRAICWDLSGRYIASVSEDSARIFSIASGRKCIYELPSNGYSFHSCTFHPRYSDLLVLGSYQSIGLWNPIEGSKSISHSVHEGIVAALSASPQTGMVASASHDECIKLWK